MKMRLLIFLTGLVISSSVFAISSPTNTAPANGAVGQSVAVTIDWSSVTGNTGYIYQLDTTPLFNSTLLRQGPTSTGASQATMYDLLFNTTYYWRAATKSAVDTSAWSETWSYTTASGIYNSSPANASSNLAVTVTIDWSSIVGNTGYLYQIDYVPTFNSANLVNGTTATNSSVATIYDLRFGQTYYWRCAAKNLSDTSVWTSAWSFTTTDQIYNSTPSNGATAQAVGVTLDWSSVDGNTGYIYQYDTVAGFDSPLFATGTTAANSSQIYISNLRFGQTYYWRAAAKNAVDTSAWTSAWTFATTDQVYNFTPSDGATNQAVGVTLDWSSVDGNTGYIYQYDTVAGFDSPLFVTGATAANSSQIYISNLRFGQTYYWRVAAKNAVDTSAWTSAWTFITTDQVYNLTPSNDATNQAVGVTLDWSNVDGNTGYIYQYDTVAGFDSPLFVTGATAANTSQIYISNLRFGQTYFWRVAAKNAVDTSAWTSAWTFATTDLVSNLTPSNGATAQPVGVTLDWSSVDGNTGYIYQYDTVSGFDSPSFATGTTAANTSQIYISNLRFGQTYYWRCAAKNAVDTSAWTSTWSFTTGDNVINYTPSNGAVGISINPSLDWSSFSGATGYLCRIDTTLNFNSPELQTYSGVNSASGFAGLRYGTEYYWQAATRNAIDTSQWNTAFMFTTAFEMTTPPTLISPANSSTDISYLSVGLEWGSIVSANTYQFQVSTNSNFESLIYNNITSLVTANVSGLSPYTVYYWRVRATNANGNSPWSTVWSFTTESAIMTPPILVSPPDNSIEVSSASVLLEWNSVYGASAYVFEIAEDENFISGITTQQVSETYKEILGLSAGTEYFWRVKATDGVSDSDWSEVWSFITEIDELDVPVLVSPLNNSIDIDFNSLGLDWNPVFGATEYIYEYSSDNTFSVDVVSEIVYVTENLINGLQENTQYFWRVKASNGTIESAWSEVWNFTTDEQIVYYTLTITVEGYGFVFVNSVQYTEPVSVPVGTELSLEAVSITTWPFQQWIGDLTGNNNPEILVMDSDKHVTAEFINVSVSEIDTNESVISIYPNPASSSFFMMGDGIESVSLFSVDGRLVKSFAEYSEADGLDIIDLNSGVYFVKVNNSDTWVGKIIKE